MATAVVSGIRNEFVLPTVVRPGVPYPPRVKELVRPYKVYFPGQVDAILYPGSSSELKDPRLGQAQSLKETCIAEHAKSGCTLPLKFDDTEDVHHGDTECINKLNYWERYFLQQRRKQVKEVERDEPIFLKNCDCRCAETAIEYYNNKHGTDYKIFATLGSYMAQESGPPFVIWYHCNFIAERFGSHHTRDAQLFFAELYVDPTIDSGTPPEDRKLDVKHCQILEGAGYSSSIVRDCGMCDFRLWHPVAKFRKGRPTSPGPVGDRIRKDTNITGLTPEVVASKFRNGRPTSLSCVGDRVRKDINFMVLTPEVVATRFRNGRPASLGCIGDRVRKV